MGNWFERKLSGLARRFGVQSQVSWEDAQRFELDHAVSYMSSNPSFQLALEAVNAEANKLSKGYVDPGLLIEFFGSDEGEWRMFVDHLAGKAALEIGPCLYSRLSTWDVASRRMVIEPLYSSIMEHQRREFERTGFPGIDSAYSTPAEKLIEDIVGKIDGALLIRNCLDHTPQWPFILSNISDYMAPGAILLLWNDLMHPPIYLNGHYDITSDVASFRRLIENFGFSILVEYQNTSSDSLNYGCRAVRV